MLLYKAAAFPIVITKYKWRVFCEIYFLVFGVSSMNAVFSSSICVIQIEVGVEVVSFCFF